MESLIMFTQIFLATIFFISSISKLISRYSFMETLADVGLKNKLIPTVSWLFPIVELISAALLLVESLRLIGQLIMLCMLTGFIFLSIRAMRTDNKKISCNCFGELTQESIGIATLLRSIILTICLVPLFFIRKATGLYQLGPMELTAALFCSLGILMFYSLMVSLRNHYLEIVESV